MFFFFICIFHSSFELLVNEFKARHFLVHIAFGGNMPWVLRGNTVLLWTGLNCEVVFISETTLHVLTGNVENTVLVLLGSGLYSEVVKRKVPLYMPCFMVPVVFFLHKMDLLNHEPYSPSHDLDYPLFPAARGCRQAWHTCNGREEKKPKSH